MLFGKHHGNYHGDTMSENYIDTPCPCKEGDQCPHYGKHLVGMTWKISRADTEKARRYRQMWVEQVQARQPQADPTAGLRKVTTPRKGCGCRRK
jgi:hypothetical protein